MMMAILATSRATNFNRRRGWTEWLSVGHNAIARESSTASRPVSQSAAWRCGLSLGTGTDRSLATCAQGSGNGGYKWIETGS